MSDLTEAIKGVEPGFVHGSGGARRVYMFVDLTKREPGRVSIEELANDFALPPQRVLESLTGGSPKQLVTTNKWALEELYQAEASIYDPGLRRTTVPSALANPPKHSQAEKRELVQASSRGSGHYSLEGKEDPLYYDWSITNRGTIVLPLSTGFRQTLERYQEYRENKPLFDTFAPLVKELARDLDTLREALRELAVAAKAGLSEVAAISALHTVVDIECAMLSDPAPSESPMAELQDFLVSSAMPLFTKHLLQEPRAAKSALQKRDAAAKRILDAWQREEWITGVRTLIEHEAVVDHRLWEDTFHNLERAVLLLPLTGLRDRFTEEQVDSLVFHAWKEEMDPQFKAAIEKRLSADDAKNYIEGWKAGPAVVESVLSVASQMSVATIAIGGNLPGPMSLWVAVTRIALFHAVAHQAKAGVNVTRGGASAWILNRLAKFGGMSVQEKQHMAYAIAESHHLRGATERYTHTVKLLGVDWDKRLFRGKGLRYGTFAIAAALLLMTLTEDPRESYKGFVGFVGAAAGAGLAFADLPPISGFLTTRAPGALARGMTGVAASVSIFGIVSGLLVMKDGVARGSDLEVLEGALGAGGSAVSLAGWLAGSVFAVPIPQYVMVVGTVLVLASIGVAVWGMVQNSVEEFVKGILNALEDENSLAQRADLSPTVAILRELVEGASFEPIFAMFRKDLEARGFPAELAEGLTA